MVRVGETVRRPTGPHSAFVHRLLCVLDEAGIRAAPRLLGIDDLGREVLTFRPGWVPPDLESRRWRDEQLVAAAHIVRSVHDATAGSPLAHASEVVCHGDLSPCNFVFVDARPRYLIDFDRAHPGSRKADLAYMAWCWLVGSEEERRAPPLAERLRQLGVLLDAYGLDDRDRFADAIADEQRVVLALASERGDEAAAAWARRELGFVHDHAAAIDDAARG